MIVFEAEIERFERMGEKTGWTYVFIAATIAEQIKPGCKTSFRVKGQLDGVVIEGLALAPMGEGNFILPLKAALRKQLHKEEGAKLQLVLEEDKDFKMEMPEDLELCLLENKHHLDNFLNMPKSHQNYYINWLNSAKTEPTRVKRLTKIVMAMEEKMDFGEMMRKKD